MTIAAGFQCRDGVLVCADTEYSAYGFKLYDDKIFKVETDHLKARFSFTGNVELALAVIYKCIHKLESSKANSLKSHYDVALMVEQVVNAEYRKHVSGNPEPNGESVYQLLLAAWCSQSEGAAIYSTFQGTIKPIPRYTCLGAGLYVGHYLIGPIFNQTMDLESARILGLYTVAAAKEHVEGVGGKTSMISIAHDGAVVPIDSFNIEPIEEALKLYNGYARRLLFGLLSSEDSQFNSSLEFFGKISRHIRNNLEIDDESQAENRAANERLINYLTSLATQPNQ